MRPFSSEKSDYHKLSVLSYTVDTYGTSEKYKTKLVRLPLPILYSKDAIAGGTSSAVPMNDGSRVYIGKVYEQDSYVAIKEVVLKHRKVEKQGHSDRSRSLSLKKGLLNEYRYLQQTRSDCGPIQYFENKSGTRLYAVQNLMTGTADSVLDYLRPNQTGPRGRASVFIMAALAARNLIELHENDVLHFDIKPPNIAYSKATNRVQFIDFGSAADGPTAIPRQMTIPYASNSQLQGNDCSYRDDIVSLGVTFVELMCGERLWGKYKTHASYLLGELKSEDNFVRVSGLVKKQSPEFWALCVRMIDTRTFPFLKAERVYGDVSNLLEEVPDREYEEAREAWNRLPDFLPAIERRVKDLQRRENLVSIAA